MTKQLKLQHVLWRAGFGPALHDKDTWLSMPEQDWWPAIRKASAAPPQTFDVASNAFEGLTMGIGELGQQEKRELSKEEKKKLKEQSREDLKSLNLLWLDTMVHSPAQLREKTALFWHGHFASRNINILYQQQLLDVVRRNALGKFGDLLRGVSKSAAMLAFLNNQQNKKQHPNENFAREVMELFTLGRGHYTETDVTEAARAFTGWGFKLSGEFVFRERDHDAGSKTILGRTGHFTGDDVLDILLEQRQTAHYISGKFARCFCGEQPLHPDVHKELARRFYDSGYDISDLLDAMFESPWFYKRERIGARIKSPVEWWVGIRRALPFTLEYPEAQLAMQRALGQILFYPPGVAGWPGGKHWIDSSSLMLRLRAPLLLYGGQELDVRTKDDDDQQMGQGEDGKKARKQLVARINERQLAEAFSKVPNSDVFNHLTDFLWQANAAVPTRLLEQYADASSPEKRLVSTAIYLMATPEYQLC